MNNADRVASVVKVATGIPGFDFISDGGLPRGRTALVAGTPRGQLYRDAVGVRQPNPALVLAATAAGPAVISLGLSHYREGAVFVGNDAASGDDLGGSEFRQS